MYSYFICLERILSNVNIFLDNYKVKNKATLALIQWNWFHFCNSYKNCVNILFDAKSDMWNRFWKFVKLSPMEKGESSFSKKYTIPKKIINLDFLTLEYVYTINILHTIHISRGVILTFVSGVQTPQNMRENKITDIFAWLRLFWAKKWGCLGTPGNYTTDIWFSKKKTHSEATLRFFNKW